MWARRANGVGLEAGAIDATRLRFRAVMMTGLSFILGVKPLLFATGAGAASRVSVGYVVFFGMLAATVIGMVFVPVLYVAIQRIREYVASWGKPASEAATIRLAWSSTSGDANIIIHARIRP